MEIEKEPKCKNCLVLVAREVPGAVLTAAFVEERRGVASPADLLHQRFGLEVNLEATRILEVKGRLEVRRKEKGYSHALSGLIYSRGLHQPGSSGLYIKI